ncbi:MAG: M23 family metallopeptidase [Candidatus Hydrogenedentota bacterium]|nr:MAG: M23 family metallopeptidase [Candidatus Hydrogenedentota bacterium]
MKFWMILFLILPYILYPFEWPVKQNKTKSLIISSTFGESRLDHFHNGLDIPGENRKVYPVAKGKVVWQTKGNRRYGEIPFGGGTTMILYHPKEKMLSGYMHLKPSLDNWENNRFVNPNVAMGRSGKSGHSGGAHLHFFLFSLLEKAMLNPLLALPEDFYRNESKPKIKEYAILLPDRVSILNPEKPFSLSGNYPLLARVVDSATATSKERWGIYFLKVETDTGSSLQSLLFQKILYRNFRWQTENLQVFEQVYAGPYYILAYDLLKHPNLKITAGGYKGPSLTEGLHLQVTPLKTQASP